MAYDFECPHCGYGMNADETAGIDTDDDPIGKFDVTCKNCNKEMIVESEPTILYSAHAKEKVK